MNAPGHPSRTEPTPGIRRALGALACAGLAAACTSTVERRYAMPEPGVRFAAQEACVAAGFRLIRADEDGIEGRRAPLWGVPFGSGGESIRVDLEPAGGGTEVRIVSELSFFGTLGQRHFDRRVAELLDRFVEEDRSLEPGEERR